MPITTAWSTLPCTEVLDLVRNLPPDAAFVRATTHGWGPHEENTARLLEARSFELGLQWADRTIDQDDPAVKRERLAAKRAGIKPPPHPLIPPTAFRPQPLAEERVREYLDEVQKYQVASKPAARRVTPDEFDAAIGIVAHHM